MIANRIDILPWLSLIRRFFSSGFIACFNAKAHYPSVMYNSLFQPRCLLPFDPINPPPPPSCSPSSPNRHITATTTQVLRKYFVREMVPTIPFVPLRKILFSQKESWSSFCCLWELISVHTLMPPIFNFPPIPSSPYPRSPSLLFV